MRLLAWLCPSQQTLVVYWKKGIFFPQFSPLNSASSVTWKVLFLIKEVQSLIFASSLSVSNRHVDNGLMNVLYFLVSPEVVGQLDWMIFENLFLLKFSTPFQSGSLIKLIFTSHSLPGLFLACPLLIPFNVLSVSSFRQDYSLLCLYVCDAVLLYVARSRSYRNAI